MNTLRAVAVLAFLAASAAAASAGTINVPADSPSIRTAIDMANDGDTVVVAAGTYSEFLFLDQRNNLTIQAQGVVILAPKKVKSPPAAVAFSSCQNITFEGFTVLKPPSDGISVSTCLNVTIRNCTVSLAKGFGIRSVGGQDVTVADCTVTTTGKNKGGISLSAGAGLATTRGTVQRCTVTKAGGAGIIVHGPSALIEDCTVTSAKLAGIELDRAGATHDGIVRRCTVTGAGDTGIVVTGHGHAIEDNVVNGSVKYGITVIQDADGATSGDSLRTNTVTKTKKKDGIFVNAPQCTVDTNTVSATKGDGIRVADAGSSIVSNSVTTAAAFGVHLLGSGHTVTTNNASGNKKADFWDQSTGSTVGVNTFVKIKP